MVGTTKQAATDLRLRRLDECYVRVDVLDDKYVGWTIEQYAKETLSEVKRHVDCAHAEVVKVYEHYCPFCNVVWTEDSHLYNGGCCEADQVRAIAFDAIEDKDCYQDGYIEELTVKARREYPEMFAAEYPLPISPDPIAELDKLTIRPSTEGDTNA